MAMGRVADNVASLIQQAWNSNAAFLPWKPLEQIEGGLQIFQTAIVDTAGKQEKVSSANCFYKIVKEVIIFPNTCLQYKCVTIDWAREDDEKDAGIDFENDSGPPKNWSCSVDLKTVILVTATDYEWNDDCGEIKNYPLTYLASF